jgi:hypothetical protein
MLLLFTSCSGKYTLRPEIRGAVFDESNSPIEGAEVTFIDCYNSDCNGEKVSLTTQNGTFTIKKEFKTYILYKPEQHNRPYYSYTMTVKKKNYIMDTIDIRKKEISDNVIIIDTITLRSIDR